MSSSSNYLVLSTKAQVFEFALILAAPELRLTSETRELLL